MITQAHEDVLEQLAKDHIEQLDAGWTCVRNMTSIDAEDETITFAASPTGDYPAIIVVLGVGVAPSYHVDGLVTDNWPHAVSLYETALDEKAARSR